MTRIDCEEGLYVAHLRLPPKKEEETEKVPKGKHFTILPSESEQVFSRRA